jgi:hypothetical protein
MQNLGDPVNATDASNKSHTDAMVAVETTRALAAEGGMALADLSNVGTLPTSVANQLRGADGSVGSTGAQGSTGSTGASGNDVTVTTATSGSPSGGSDGDMFFTIIT